MRLCIFEDRRVENFFPLTATRPVYALRCGALTLAEKIIRIAPGARVTFHVREYLKDVLREEYPKASVNDSRDEPMCLVNGRVIADADLAGFVRKRTPATKALVSNGEIVAVHVDRAFLPRLRDFLSGAPLDPSLFSDFAPVEFGGKLASYLWDLVDETPSEIGRDFAAITTRKKIAGKMCAGVHLLGKNNILLGRKSVVKPGVVLDAEEGPIIIGEGVTIMPNAVVIGPAFIGDHSIIKIGAKIYHGTSIGPWCKVGGEVEASVIQAFSNKQHDGFLGHSYIGSWVNLGADTNTSDLKNTYGNVHVRIHDRDIDTGRQFVGLSMGDHSKSGINVMFDTGTVVGMSSNVYGAGLPPKFVPSFSWGPSGSMERYELQKSIETARRVMKRRGIEMTPSYEKMMRVVAERPESTR